MLVFFALGNAKVLSFALADAKVPNASSFAFWLNIGLMVSLSEYQILRSIYILVIKVCFTKRPRTAMVVFQNNVV